LFCFFVCFLFCFCWQLLICENTLIQVVKLKKRKKNKEKKRKKILLPLSVEPGSSASHAGDQSTRPWAFNVIVEVNFNTYFFLRDKLTISMKMLVFFLAKCVRNAVKTMFVDRKNKKH